MGLGQVKPSRGGALLRVMGDMGRLGPVLGYFHHILELSIHDAIRNVSQSCIELKLQLQVAFALWIEQFAVGVPATHVVEEV